jgi:hypothetical protein
VLHVTSSENDDVIQTYAPGTANESFANRIHQGRLNSCAQYFHPCAFCDTVEYCPKLVVIIANDELGSVTEWRNITKLLRCPLRGWGASNANVHNSLRIDIHDEERKDGPKPNVIDVQEIAGPNRMVSQKCAPSLAAREFGYSAFGHVSLDCSLCDSDAKLQKFAAYSFRAP